MKNRIFKTTDAAISQILFDNGNPLNADVSVETKKQSPRCYCGESIQQEIIISDIAVEFVTICDVCGEE